MMFMMHRRREKHPLPPVVLAPWNHESREALQWAQTGTWSSRWELRHGDSIFATVQCKSIWDTAWSIDFANASWLLRARWTGTLEARTPGGEAVLARYKPGVFSGSIVRPGLPDLRVKSGGFFRPYAEIQTGEQFPLVRYRIGNGFTRFEAQVEIEDAARSLGGLELLLGLSWAGVVADYRRSTAAAAT